MMEETATWSSDEDSQVKRERERNIARRIKATPAAVFFDQQRKKAREQRMKDMRKALLEHLTDVPEVVLKQRLHLSAFHPPSFYPKNVERIHTKHEELGLTMTQKEELTEEKMKTSSEVYQDAETGELISLTKAKWSSVEGRLNYNRQSIIDMGTGRLNLKLSMSSPTTSSMKDVMSESMKESVHSLPSNEKWDPLMETMSITNDRPHPLVKKFLAEGPINLRVHKLWSPKTDALIPQPELRVLYVEENDKRDDDIVSAKSSLSGGTATHISKIVPRMMDGSIVVSSHGSGHSYNPHNAAKNLGSIFSSGDSTTIGPSQMLQPVTSVHVTKSPISSPPRNTTSISKGKSRSHTLPSLSHRTQSPVEAAVETAFGSVSSLGSVQKGFPTTKNKKADGGNSSMTLSLSSSDRPLAIHETNPKLLGSGSISSASTSKGGLSSVKLGSIWKRPDRTYENEVLYQWYFSRLNNNKLNDSLSSVSSYDEHLHEGSKLKLESSIGGSLTMGSVMGGWQRLEDGYFQQLYQIATEMDQLRILRSDKGLGTGFGVGNGIDHTSLAIALDPNPPPINSMKDIFRNLEMVSEKEYNFNKLQDKLTAEVCETLSVNSMDSHDSSMGSVVSSTSQNSSQLRGGKYPSNRKSNKGRIGGGGVLRGSSMRKKENDGSMNSQKSSSRVGTSQSSERNSISIIQDDNNSSIHTLSSSGNGGSSSSMIKLPGKQSEDRTSSRPTSKGVKVKVISSSNGNNNDPQLNEVQSNLSLPARPSKNPSKNSSRFPSKNPFRNPSTSPSRNPSQSPSRCNSSPGRNRHGGKTRTGTTDKTDKEFTRMGTRIGRRTHRHHGIHHEDSTLSSKEYDLVESCHIVARFKVNNLIELAQAIKDEEDMIAKKRKELGENKKMSKNLAQNLRKKEKERRHAKRIYLRTLQYDNEIRLMKKMREVKLLW